MKSLKSNVLVKGSFLSLTLRIIGIFSSYFMFWILSVKGGASRVGDFSVGLNFLQFLGQLATLGLPIAILRYASPLSYQQKWIKLKDLRNRFFILQIIIGLLFSSLSFFIGYIFYLEKLNNNIITLLIISFASTFYALNILMADFIRAIGEIKFSEFVRVIFVPTLTSILLVFHINLQLKFNEIFIYILSVLLSSLLSIIYSNIKLRNHLRDCNGFDEPIEDKLSFIEILKTSIPMTITSFAILFMGKINIFALAYFCSNLEVGLYTIPLKLATTTSIVLQAVNTVVAPKISEQFWGNDRDKLQNTIQLSARLSLLGSIPFLLIFFIFPEFCLGLFGEDFVQSSIALRILVIGQIVNSSCGSVGTYLNMTGKEKILSLFIVISLFFSLLLNVILVPTFGVLGASIATAIPMIIWNLSSTIYTKLKFNISTYINLKI